MHIEETLQSIDSKLGAILAALSTGAQLAPAENIAAGAAAVEASGLTGAQAEPIPGTPARRGRGAAKTTSSTTTTAPAAATPAPEVKSANDFMSLGEPETIVAEKHVTLAEVRAALAIVVARDGQPAAMALFSKATGVETFAKLTSDKYAAVFKAAVPSGAIDINDVRSVLVRANERKSESGLAVLKKNGFETLKTVTPDKYVAIICDAHGVI